MTGRSITPKDITITTLRGVFFNDIKNDISFRTGDRDIILMEHQSSWNPNMPLRMLWYIAKLYSRQLDSQELVYRSSLIHIPAPEFYVFYNGSQDEPDCQKLRLSNAFAHATNTLELIVDCYNINYSPPGTNSLTPATNSAATASSYRKSEMASRMGSNSKPPSARPSPTEKHTISWLTISQKNESEVFDMVNFKGD